MQKIFISSLLIIAVAFSAMAQDAVDYLVYKGEKTPVKILEVGSKQIKYRYPGEEAVYSMSKLQVEKVIFASGREEVFDVPVKPVKGLSDANNVYLTYIQDEVDGLLSKGSVFSKAVGVTTLSAINTVNNRATDKLKAEAAMLGANVVFVGNTFTRGNQAGGQNQAGVSTMTSLSGTAFSTDKISLDEVQALTAGKEFLPFMINKLNRNAWSPNTFNPFYESKKPLEKLTLNGFYVEDGKVMIKTNQVPQTKQQVFEVVNLEADGFITLMHRDSKVIYNYIFIDTDHEFAQAYLNSRVQ